MDYIIEGKPIKCDCCKKRDAADHMIAKDSTDQNVTIYFCSNCGCYPTSVMLHFFGLAR